MDKKKSPNPTCLQESNFKYKNTDRLKLKGWRKTYNANINQKEVEVAILSLDKADFRVRQNVKDKAGYCFIFGKGIYSPRIHDNL